MRAGLRFCSLTVLACSLSAIPGAIGREGMEPQGKRHAEITIWLYNYAEVPRQTVAKTKMEIAKILNQAGVVTRWIDCPVLSTWTEGQAGCQERMSPSELAILLFHKFTLPNGVSRDTQLGSAEVFPDGHPGHYIYLSYDRIRESAYPEGFCSPETLAAAAVHEIGHVLFRSMDHSPTGLMRARWDRQDFQNAAIGGLRFTARQAGILRAEVEARMELTAAERSRAGDQRKKTALVSDKVKR